MKIFAPAKVNLTLDIVGVRNDGYHLMEMVMQTVSLYDVVELFPVGRSPSENALPGGDIRFSCNVPYLPTDGRNLAVRAADAFYQYTGVRGGVKIYLKKHIPSGAGMGGGSADAAAILAGLNRLFKTELPLPELMDLGSAVGADVPFCLHGGTGLAEGIGERITRLDPLPHCWLVVVKPKLSVNTKAAFAAFDQGEIACRPDNDAMLAALRARSLPEISREMGNVFEQTADPAQREELMKIKEELYGYGASGAVMTGSGSAVFGVFDQKPQAVSCRRMLARPEQRSYLCEPVPHGPLIQPE